MGPPLISGPVRFDRRFAPYAFVGDEYPGLRPGRRRSYRGDWEDTLRVVFR